jgi:hypothetical protein
MNTKILITITRLTLAILCIALVASAHAAESIKSYSVNITLLTDGSVDVTETIKVNGENKRIKHGIFRDIPTKLLNADGSLVHSNLSIVSVEKDGISETYSTKDIPNGTRIYIGNKDILLRKQTNIYTIRYTMTRMGRYFE